MGHEKTCIQSVMKMDSYNLQKLKGDSVEMIDNVSKQQLREPGGMDQKKYHSSKNFILRKIAGETVIVSIGEGVADFCGIISLNSSAEVLWQAMEKPKTKEELVAILQEKFEVDASEARKDIEASLKLLGEYGMLEYE